MSRTIPSTLLSRRSAIGAMILTSIATSLNEIAEARIDFTRVS